MQAEKKKGKGRKAGNPALKRVRFIAVALTESESELLDKLVEAAGAANRSEYVRSKLFRGA